jgi:hypothetical protein
MKRQRNIAYVQQLAKSLIFLGPRLDSLTTTFTFACLEIFSALCFRISDPIIARAIVRGPQKSVKCKELYHSPEFHRRVPRLAFLHEGMAWYAGDSFFGLTENTLFVVLHFEDHDAVIIQSGKQLNDVPMRMPAVQLLGRLIIYTTRPAGSTTGFVMSFMSGWR